MSSEDPSNPSLVQESSEVDNDPIDSTSPSDAERPQEPAAVERTLLPVEDHWSCIACGHYESVELMRCSGCQRFRVLSLSKIPILAKSPVQIPEEVSTSPEDQRLLSVAFDRLQELFLKAQVEGRTLDEADRAKLYETLLVSFLKIEREEVRRVAFRDVFQENREEKQRSHMIHLSIIWFLGICTGFALYFALDAVR